MRGRKSIPPELKLVTGKKGRGINNEAPQYSHDAPERPSWLRGKVAQTEWKRVCKLLDDAGVLTVADGNALAMYCYIIGQIDDFSKRVEEQGPLIEGDVNPLVVRMEKLMVELRAYSALFGMDPANRSKVNAAPTSTEKPEGKGRFFK